MNLIEEAESLMLYQFSHSPKFTALVRCLVQPFQEALDELLKLHHGHYIDQAYGQTLDVMGAIVDQPRLGMSDEDYRPWIKVAMLRITNGGTAKGIWAILSVLYKKIPDITLKEYAPNEVHFTLFELPAFPKETLLSIVKQSMPLGTKCKFIPAAPRALKQKSKLHAHAEPDLPAFRLDYTAFSQAYFADFMEGE